MKRNTIKWKILRYNLIVIVVLIVMTTIVFNAAVRFYMEKEIIDQLNKIAARTEDTALRQGPDLFPGGRRNPASPPPPDGKAEAREDENEPFRFYFMLDRSLREPLSVLNADYLMLDLNKEIINALPEELSGVPQELLNRITDEIDLLESIDKETYLNFNLSGGEYVAIVKPVSRENSFGLGWIVIYSSLQKVNQLQGTINIILCIILIVSAVIAAVFSSHAAKRISAPFSSLNRHIKAISERNFGSKIDMPVYDELQEFVNNINTMSEKLETHDKAQKTFLQNASHEYRTPLMSIQSYAEGIKYQVVESGTAADIIIDEAKRMTRLVEDLLYLSRLDAIEESYSFNPLSLDDMIKGCVERMNAIAAKNGIEIAYDAADTGMEIYGDEEKLSRAVANILGNCIRYAKSAVKIASKAAGDGFLELVISDDGPGFDANELPNIFDRFYSGRKGNFGLGLTISRNVIEKHSGRITAENSSLGAKFVIVLPAARIEEQA